MTRTISAGQLAQLAADIDRALDKLEEHTYGTCDECKGPIAPERLEALPWATRCVGCQGQTQSQGQRQSQQKARP
jgi:RNA polymerase-binding transcription factor DksA